MKIGKKIKLAVIVLFAVFVLLQLIPISRDNPPITADFSGDPAVKQILRRSCYDCHSNETTWPWYSWVAPISWLVAGDVNEAREHFNFSEWQDIPTDDQRVIIKRMWKEIDEGEMPPGLYLLMHSEAKLSESENSLIRTWAEGLPPSDTDSTETETEPE